MTRKQGSGSGMKGANLLMMSFSARCTLPFGDRLCLIGSCQELAEWNLQKALPLTWNDGDLWSIQVALPEREVIRYKVRFRSCSTDGGRRRIQTHVFHPIFFPFCSSLCRGATALTSGSLEKTVPRSQAQTQCAGPALGYLSIMS